MGKVIGFTYDLKSDWIEQEGDPVDASAEFDGTKTIDEIQKALELGGHEVKRIGNVRNLLAQINDLKVDIVLNICEGQRGRNRESQVPIILEMYGIPFVGSDALTMGITLDKVVAKKCFIADGLPTARYFIAGRDSNLKKLSSIGFPLFVKTLHEGTSKGLTKDSKVENFEALKERVEFINTHYHQPALVEEFISGSEFTVGVIGNKEPQALPVVQYLIDGKADCGDSFYTYDHVVAKSVKYVCPAKVSDELQRTLQELAVRAYQSVGCRDFGRVDFRVDKKGNPFILEINPLPNLSKEEVFALAPKAMGSNYDEMINQILNFALERQGLLKEETYKR